MNPMPASRMQSPICSGESSIFTPKAESTSAAPDRDDKARLPCLATGTPAPATISAAQVEMLNEPEASPPVPTTSIAFGGARTRNAINSPPICDGVASPAIICSKPTAASSRVSAAPVATLAMSDLNSTVTARPSIDPRPRRARGSFVGAAPSGRAIPRFGDFEKVLEQQMTVLGGDAFGVELHAVHWQALMRKPHHQTVIGLGRNVEIARHALALNHQRMIARRFERCIDAAKYAAAAMLDLRQFPMNWNRRAHDFATEGLADRLVTQANAKDRDPRRSGSNQIKTDAGPWRLLGSPGDRPGLRW